MLAAAEDGPIRCVEVAALSVDDVAAVQQQLRSRVLRWFVRAGTLDASAAPRVRAYRLGAFAMRPNRVVRLKFLSVAKTSDAIVVCES